MPAPGPSLQLACHPLDLAFDARTELVDGERIPRVQHELIQLGLLAIALEVELLVAEERVIGDAIRLDLQRFAAPGPRQVPWLRTHG
jgi:hypothetical protein